MRLGRKGRVSMTTHNAASSATPLEKQASKRCDLGPVCADLPQAIEQYGSWVVARALDISKSPEDKGSWLTARWKPVDSPFWYSPGGITCLNKLIAFCRIYWALWDPCLCAYIHRNLQGEKAQPLPLTIRSIFLFNLGNLGQKNLKRLDPHHSQCSGSDIGGLTFYYFFIKIKQNQQLHKIVAGYFCRLQAFYLFGRTIYSTIYIPNLNLKLTKLDFIYK